MSEIADILDGLADDLMARSTKERADMIASRTSHMAIASGGAAIALVEASNAFRKAAAKARGEAG